MKRNSISIQKKSRINRNQLNTFRYVLLFTLFILIIFTVSFYQSTKDASKLRILDVTLNVKAPFSNATLLVNKSGKLTYSATDFSNNSLDVIDSKTISPENFNDLENIIFANNFFKMNNKPANVMSPTDGTTYVLTVHTLPKNQKLSARVYPGSYQVFCYEFNCESGFLEIKNKVIELWGKKVLEIGI